MKLKILIVAALLISVVTSMIGCDNDEYFLKNVFKNEIEYEGVIYKKMSMTGHEPYWTVTFLSESGKNRENVFVYDEINNIPVKTIGTKALGQDIARFYGENTKRIYFPWCIDDKTEDISWGSNIKYVISASAVSIVDTYQLTNFAIPKSAYDIAVETNYLGEPFYHGTDNLIPANISYMFNYESNPNEGYFFIDLLEESGKLTKPPYDPKRDGYNFSGWYKEAECINEWNFNTDIVSIEYDEEGNRIYEEICLYAKWKLNN